MENAPFAWWQRGVVYQIYPRSFADATGDGIGDLLGIIGKLDYLRWTLGVDAIWLSPFYPSPMADFGYDVANYVDVDPLFGDLATFDRLIAEAHARDLRVIIDYVPNHTSDQHPWFRESRASRDNPKRDWYVWRDAKADGSPPNNWLSTFGGSAWTYDAETGQYYLHSFLKEQPDLNWRNPHVKAAMFDVLRFWLDRGVDGFRIDVAHHILKDPALRDNPPNTNHNGGMHKALGDFDSQLHLYDRGHTDVHAIYRELRAVLDSYGGERPRIAIGEIHIFDLPEWMRYYGQELDEFHLPYNFGLLSVPWDAAAVRASVDALESSLPVGAWPNYVLGNHDEPRVATRIGREQARVAMMLLLTLRGTPTLYYGDELGMENVVILPDQVRDPWERNVPGLGLGRDGERTPMQWTAEPNAGFCPPDVTPWLPIAPDYRDQNVAVQQTDPHAMLSLTNHLLMLRRTHQALAIGSYRPVDGLPVACYGYMREAAGERFLIVLNFTSEPCMIALNCASCQVLLSTYLDRTGLVKAQELTLRPHEGCILHMGDSDEHA